MLRLLPILALAACGTPKTPVFFEPLELISTPVDPGALEGRFGLILVATALVDAPIVGEKQGGGETWHLVDRSWDGETYTQTTHVCGGVVYDVGDNRSFIPAATRRKLAPSTTHALDLVDHTGTYSVKGHLELWGLTGLPDPYETPLPQNARAAGEPPHADRIVDVEGDGNPGITVQVEGVIDGEQYFIQRRIVDLEGVSLGENRLIGLNFTDIEQVTLGASSLFLDVQATIVAHPDPRRSWFEEVRLSGDADCDAVQAAIDDGRLGGKRPPF